MGGSGVSRASRSVAGLAMRRARRCCLNNTKGQVRRREAAAHPCCTPRPCPPPPPPPPRSWGLILYRTRLPAKALEKDAALDLGGPPHDYAVRFLHLLRTCGPAGHGCRVPAARGAPAPFPAPCIHPAGPAALPRCPTAPLQSVLVDGELAGRLDRSQPATNLTLPARHAGALSGGWLGWGTGGRGLAEPLPLEALPCQSCQCP